MSDRRQVRFGAALVALVLSACSSSSGHALATPSTVTPPVALATATSSTTAASTSPQPRPATAVPPASTEAPTTTVKAAPPLPDAIPGWRPEGDVVSTAVVAAGVDAVTPFNFPETQNDCGTRQISVRWRSIENPVLFGVTDFLTAHVDTPTPESSHATLDTAGYALMSGCSSPVWFGDPSLASNTVTHVVVEYRAWDAAP